MFLSLLPELGWLVIGQTHSGRYGLLSRAAPQLNLVMAWIAMISLITVLLSIDRRIV